MDGKGAVSIPLEYRVADDIEELFNRLRRFTAHRQGRQSVITREDYLVERW